MEGQSVDDQVGEATVEVLSRMYGAVVHMTLTLDICLFVIAEEVTERLGSVGWEKPRWRSRSC